MKNFLNNFFELTSNNTDIKSEIIAGTTTFLTMAYIMFLNPFILSGEFAGPEKVFLILERFLLQQLWLPHLPVLLWLFTERLGQ